MNVRIREMVVDFKTGTVRHADTDNTPHLIFTLKVNNESRGIAIKLADIPGENENERGNTTRYELRNLAIDGELLSITLVNGMNGNGPGWYLTKARIWAKSGRRWYQYVTFNTLRGTWLASHPDGLPAINLPLSFNPPEVEWMWD